MHKNFSANLVFQEGKITGKSVSILIYCYSTVQNSQEYVKPFICISEQFPVNKEFNKLSFQLGVNTKIFLEYTFFILNKIILYH